MELFGTKFSITLGAWRLRFVLMLEEEEPIAVEPVRRPAPHHVHAVSAKTPSR